MKRQIVLIAALMLVALASCGSSGYVPYSERKGSNAQFVMTEGIHDEDTRFVRYQTANSGLQNGAVYIDQKTKVIYMEVTYDNGAYKAYGGVFPLLGADGKPILFDEASAEFITEGRVTYLVPHW